MIPADLLPRPWRRAVIDSVYGAEDRRGARIYMASLWGALLVLALLLTGTTPWAWPAEREARVESLQPVTCEALLDDDDAAQQPDANRAGNRPGNAANAKGAAGAAARSRSQCRELLSPGERAQLGRTEQLVSYLRQGGAAPPALGLPDDSPLRTLVDRNICRLGGVDGGDRGALAWHVQQGIGECGSWNRTVARLPLAIWWGPIAGIIVTPLVLLLLLFLLIRHSLRLPSTRRAYRRLYGSEHKAP
jgi:hypothetical protein